MSAEEQLPPNDPTGSAALPVIPLRVSQCNIVDGAILGFGVNVLINISSPVINPMALNAFGGWIGEGILEYWVSDLNGKRLAVNRELVSGSYRSIEAFEGNERIAPLAAPGQEVAVAAFVG